MVYMDKILNKDLPVIIACSYLSNYNAYEIMKKFHYKYDRDLSVDQNRVYNYSHKGIDEVVVVFRGTHTYSDWYTNFLCLFGLQYLSFRCWRSMDIIKKTKLKYGKYKKIHGIGHSLGGFLLECSRADGIRLTYNKLVSFEDIGKTIENLQTDIRESCDLVSILELTQHGNHQSIKIIDLNPLHAHTTDDLIEANEHVIL
jgi:hypothetical protein